MRWRRLVFGVILGMAFYGPGASAQVIHTPNTLKAAKGASSPRARIGDLAWLAGRWTGDFMGGTAEEVFAPPQGEAFGRGRSLRDRRPRGIDTRPVFSFAARGVSALGGASRCGSGAREGPGERSSSHPREPRADATAGPERARATWKGVIAERR